MVSFVFESNPKYLISFCMEYLFFILWLSLCVSVDLKWVSGWQHVWVLFFCFVSFNSQYSTVLCLSVRKFSPFTFKVISDTHVFIVILLIVFWLILQLLFLFSSFLVNWWFSLLLRLHSFMLLLCLLLVLVSGYHKGLI